MTGKSEGKNNIVTLGLVSLFTDISSQMIYPLLPLFLESTLGVNKAFIGLIDGVKCSLLADRLLKATCRMVQKSILVFC